MTRGKPATVSSREPGKEILMVAVETGGAYCLHAFRGKCTSSSRSPPARTQAHDTDVSHVK